MNEIIFKGKRIYYSVKGSGNKGPLVLLHGFLEDSCIWDAITEDLKNDRQVICIDLPGHGKSEGIAQIHNMDLMAAVVHKVLETLGIQEFSVAGHSMGGYVSLELLKKFPMLIKSVMLINSTPVEDTVEKREIRDRSVQLVEKNKSAFVSMAITNLYSESSKVKFAAEIEELKSRAIEMKAEDIQAALNGMKNRTNYLEELMGFSGQKMIVVGKEDPILNYRDLEGIARGCNAEYLVLENGHNSYMEASNDLIEIMHLID
ncbi:MAG: alpha/beta hydrolase [Gramella sp.]|nr:alpha/beta hydrolase [Christiangramia sp.]